METEKELNAKIIKLKREIMEKNPEIVHFLSEMPITIPNESNPEINIKILTDYYESLVAIIKEHGEIESLDL